MSKDSYSTTRPIKKILVANRSEIAIRICRSATELGIRTVAIYAYEDRFALHRFKADEAYQVGTEGEPIKSYLNIDAIIDIAKKAGVDAIHPGYGFLSENANLAKACVANGIIFIGPNATILNSFGDKVKARALATKAKVPVLGGSSKAVRTIKEAIKQSSTQGYPVMLKAAHGGGGRGMRVIRDEASLIKQYPEAQNEAEKAFGNGEVFIEKFIEHAKHIEVQLLGDHHGNLVHLYERDCSVQRRHQKVVEIAPSPNVPDEVRLAICEAAIKLGKTAGYMNAGTVEFLLDSKTNQFYFIEVNPRVQVEHTVTEEVTGIDIVKSQILIAQGVPLNDDRIGIKDQSSVHVQGFALQCRVTTEDPTNNFTPDYGKIEHYRSASGGGIRLDAGSAYSGAYVYPFYDSMLVKVTARGRTFEESIGRMNRALREFRVRGVKTNIIFLLKLLNHPTFISGDCGTRFIDEHKELFVFELRQDRATRLLTYLADVAVNGQHSVENKIKPARRKEVSLGLDLDPQFSTSTSKLTGLRDKFLEVGADEFSQWVGKQKEIFITDTTFRDAHQSLLATRMRSYDMLKVSDYYAQHASQLFSLEMWGGATFDTSMRFLQESPWQRLADMREKIPNILFQMLLRGSSALGYSNYPDNLVKLFVRESAQAGMDIFRVFDALNYLPNMKVAMEAVRKEGALCEACICYTGDITDPTRTKYALDYYIDLAKKLEKMGAHFIAIKDMAGLLKPDAATILVQALKQEISLPIHLHTHDTSGIQAATIMNAVNAGVDIFDAAMAPFSGNTSQPNLNTLVEALKQHKRKTSLDSKRLNAIGDYWRSTRDFYTPFESQSIPAMADLYEHEMPGGQYTNLYQQASALGLSDKWIDVCKMYARVNQLFGDIVKVTPSSKAVGDMALFMVANNYTEKDILDKNRDLAIPASVQDLIGGMMGKPHGGFPAKVKKAILKDKKPIKGRAGASLEPIDFDKVKAELAKLVDPTQAKKLCNKDVLAYCMYPKVFLDYAAHKKTYGDTSILPTPMFFYGLELGEEISVDIEQGKRLIIKYLAMGDAKADGNRTVFFELNGLPREITVRDKLLSADMATIEKADANDPKQIGSPMPGMIVNTFVKKGDKVTKGQTLFTLEAMKMESTIYCEVDGVVRDVLLDKGMQVKTNDLVIRLE